MKKLFCLLLAALLLCPLAACGREGHRTKSPLRRMQKAPPRLTLT